MAVCEFRVLFLQVPRIRQQHRAQIRGCLRAEDRSGKPLLDQQRQIAGVIEMSMREQNRIDPARVYREARPISLSQLLEALEKAAIDQQPVIGIFEEVFGPRDSPGSP